MTATLRAHAQRRREDRLIEVIDCLDCDAPRGKRCIDRFGRERITCCQAREDLGAPIAYELFKMAELLDEFGVAS